MLVYESVVKTTKLNLLEQKSELKQLELTSKDQLKMMQQYFAFLNTQMHSFLNKLSRGKMKFEKKNKKKSKK